MNERLKELKAIIFDTLERASDLKELEEARIAFLGKKGELSQLLKGLGTVAAEERKVMGQLLNEARTVVEARFEEAKDSILVKANEIKLAQEKIDVTMPGRRPSLGHKHPMTIVIEDIKKIFIGLGYEIAEGPEIETDYYNFEALNISKEHPARDEQDTFYTEGGFILRTATSPMQVRVMEKGNLPIKVIAPGKVYRSDEVDATHSPTFHQLEGLVIDEKITMGDLKGSLQLLAKELFGEDAKVRFRPHYFPFTEPSAEMDISCFSCGGKGCRVCKDSGFIEILGCGMVHPRVLEMSGIDPKKYSGFAFGMGLERIAMQRYNISDMRLLFENDVKFLSQF